MIQYVILAVTLNVGGFFLSMPFIYLQYFWSQTFITFVMAMIIFFFILENWSIMKELTETLNDNKNNIFIKSNYHQDIKDLHFRLFVLNGTREKLSIENEKLNNLITYNNKNNHNNDKLMICVGKQALNLKEINENIARLSLFQSKTHCSKPAHDKEKPVYEIAKDQNKISRKIRKFSSFNDSY